MAVGEAVVYVYGNAVRAMSIDAGTNDIGVDAVAGNGSYAIRL
jgi:hypothetical protein